MVEEYKTIADTGKGIYKDKGSKFIALAYPVSDMKAIEHIISEVKQEHHSAKHHCYAYRIGVNDPSYRMNDDGEPPHSAGHPIFNQIYHYDLTNILVIVVRYFGGKLLGVNGLIRAYREAAKNALNQAGIVKRRLKEMYKLTFGYAHLDAVMKILHQLNIGFQNQEFENEACKLSIIIQQQHVNEVLDQLYALDPKIDIDFVQTV